MNSLASDLGSKNERHKAKRDITYLMSKSNSEIDL